MGLSESGSGGCITSANVCLKGGGVDKGHHCCVPLRDMGLIEPCITNVDGGEEHGAEALTRHTPKTTAQQDGWCRRVGGCGTMNSVTMDGRV